MIEEICKALVPVWSIIFCGLSDAELDAELVTDVDQYAYDFLRNHLQDQEFVDIMKRQLQLRYLEHTQRNSMRIIMNTNGTFDEDQPKDCDMIGKLYESMMRELDIEPIKLTRITDLNIFATINAETDELLDMIASEYPSLDSDDK